MFLLKQITYSPGIFLTRLTSILSADICVYGKPYGIRQVLGKRGPKSKIFHLRKMIWRVSDYDY